MNTKYLLFLIIPLLAVIYSCSPQKRMAKKKHAYMGSVYNSLKDSVGDAEVTIVSDTVKVLFPEHLLFQKNSSAINTDAFPLLQRFAQVLNRYDMTTIMIQGYTDMTGTEAINKKLSQERADSAKNVLVYYTVNKDRLYSWGLGPARPIADNNTAEGQRRNRRVEFMVLYNYKSSE